MIPDKEFFEFNREKDSRINKIIKNEHLLIGSMVYETWLGADIYFERLPNKYWNFTFYRRLRGTPLEIMMLLIALVSIKRRTAIWYNQPKKPFKIEIKQFLLELNVKGESNIETAEDVLYTIKDSIDYGFETQYGLEKNYLTIGEIKELTKYYQQASISLAMAFQFLASMAAMRRLGYDVTEFQNLLVSKKKYDMLQIVDAIELSLDSNNIDFEEVKKIFKIMYPNIDKIQKGAFEIADIQQNTMTESQTFHIALSFAGEDRDVAQKIAKSLVEGGYDVFYDDFEKADLWGKDLYVHLNDLYSKRSKFCLMIISKSYANKLWTNHERRAAQAKAFRQNEEYILPLRLDDTEIPGINETIGYVDYNKTSFPELISLLKQKINK